MARVLVLLPAGDFDPSEAAVGWRVLVNAGHVVNFATPDGRPAIADDMMLTGKGLDLWGAIPLLRNLPLVGLLMRANRDARTAYAEMTADPGYLAPLRWDLIDASAFDALLLPGGHRARGMVTSLKVTFFKTWSPVISMTENRWRRSATACCWPPAALRNGRDARFFGDTRLPL